MSTVEAGKVVSIEFVLRDENGEELDRTPEGQQLHYLHGHHGIVPGLEEALAGKSVGDRVEAVVPPEKAYGPKRKVKLQEILRSKFPPDAVVERGARFFAEGSDGRPMPIWVVKVQGKSIYVTPEHPLAGMTLHYEARVTAIRDATDDEKAHGHAHGAHGHADH